MNAPLKIHLVELIEQAEELPPAPIVLTKLISLSNDANQDMEVICNVIRRDPVLTAHIIRASNAASQGVDHAIGTVEEAVFRLGFNSVYRKALAICSQSLLKTPSFPGYKSNQLWTHSLSTAIGTRTVAGMAGLNSEFGYTAGLLHDIGKMVICRHLRPRQYEELFAYAKERQRPLVDVESEFLGIDHSTLAQELLTYWNTPAAICEGIQDHHRWQSEFGAAVQTADILSYEIDLGFGGYNLPTTLQEAREKLRIGENELQEARTLIHEEVKTETERLSSP